MYFKLLINVQFGLWAVKHCSNKIEIEIENIYKTAKLLSTKKPEFRFTPENYHACVNSAFECYLSKKYHFME